MSEPPSDRNLGEQPIQKLLDRLGLTRHDLVAAAPEPITHKMVARACKGRWLTPNSRRKVLNALNQLSPDPFSESDLFHY